ncbi:MAG: beta-ketoacyl synthase N-terminal-like domain-containing protein, partial [bacterium]|nr:beta-ketoacyl synthase N-terminal-like domain-containing protein [bacterium]
MNEVAITGIGIVSCLGTGREKVSKSLKEGRSGVISDPERERIGFRSPLVGAINDFVPPKLERKRCRTMTTFGLQAYAAALEAIEMSGWEDVHIKSDDTGLIIGNDSTTLANYNQVDITLKEKSTFPIGAG